MGLSQVEKFLPGARWLRGYTAQFFVYDLIAGITVGLTVLPQGLAYATLAGLEPQYGLYSAFVGGVVYAMLGGCREVTIGPTALLALMTSRHTGLGGTSGPQLAILLCFLSGIVELIMALLKLGALVDLISLPVTVGFTSATALIIGASQLKVRNHQKTLIISQLINKKARNFNLVTLLALTYSTSFNSQKFQFKLEKSDFKNSQGKK